MITLFRICENLTVCLKGIGARNRRRVKYERVKRPSRSDGKKLTTWYEQWVLGWVVIDKLEDMFTSGSRDLDCRPVPPHHLNWFSVDSYVSPFDYLSHPRLPLSPWTVKFRPQGLRFRYLIITRHETILDPVCWPSIRLLLTRNGGLDTEDNLDTAI